MKTLILTFAACILFVGFVFAEEKNEALVEKTSMAENEFIAQCTELVKICQSQYELANVCSPEVIIINESNDCMLAGSANNINIIRLRIESNFLTEIQGTSFYKIERHLPTMGFENSIVINK